MPTFLSFSVESGCLGKERGTNSHSGLSASSKFSYVIGISNTSVSETLSNFLNLNSITCPLLPATHNLLQIGKMRGLVELFEIRFINI